MNRIKTERNETTLSWITSRAKQTMLEPIEKIVLGVMVHVILSALLVQILAVILGFML